MSVIVARDAMGFCPGCGVQIEAGETVFLAAGGATHMGCQRKLEHIETQKKESAQSSSKFEPKEESQSGFLFRDSEIAVIENAKKVVGVKHICFDGATVLGIDTPRLSNQLARVFQLMRDGRFRTLAQIAAASACLETSASARLRDFRKTRFGGHTVVSRQVEGVPLVYEYRLIVNERKEADGRRNAA